MLPVGPRIPQRRRHGWSRRSQAPPRRRREANVLPNLDLAYAPPFSPAKDPVIIAGFVSGNKDKNKFKEITADDLYNIIRSENRHNHQIIDVRAPIELEKQGKIESSINLELDQLRDNLDNLDKDIPTIVYCARGLRGYVGAMILENNGFKNVFNLGGGFIIWKKLGMEIKSYSTENK